MKLFKEFFEPVEIIQEDVKEPIGAEDVLEELENLTPGVHKMKAEYHADMAMAASHRKDTGEFQKHMAAHYDHMHAFHTKSGNTEKADEAKTKRSQYLKEEGALEVEFEPLTESARFDLAAYHDEMAGSCLKSGDDQGHNLHKAMHHDHMAHALAGKKKTDSEWHTRIADAYRNKTKKVGDLSKLNEALDQRLLKEGYRKLSPHERLNNRLNKLDPDREARHKKIRELYMQTHDGKTPEQVEREKTEKMHAEIRAELAKHDHHQ